MINWTYGPTVPAGVSFARQNLPLIVEKAKQRRTSKHRRNGARRVGNAVLVWRSAVGVDAHGNLIYAAGEDQTVGSLAKALIRAGAVRAMELDINPTGRASSRTASPDALEPEQPARRHGTPRHALPRTDDRDFFAVNLR